MANKAYTFALWSSYTKFFIYMQVHRSTLAVPLATVDISKHTELVWAGKIPVVTHEPTLPDNPKMYTTHVVWCIMCMCVYVCALCVVIIVWLCECSTRAYSDYTVIGVQQTTPCRTSDPHVHETIRIAHSIP